MDEYETVTVFVSDGEIISNVLDDPSNLATVPLPTAAIEAGELLSGSVDVLQDSTNQLYQESNGFILGRIPIALCLLLMIVIGIFKVI